MNLPALDAKRARLRLELQRAYGEWLTATVGGLGLDNAKGSAIDVSGCQDSDKAKWLAYLEAKERLVKAYAELPLAA